MVAVTITQITPPELEALIEGAIRRSLSTLEQGGQPERSSDYLTRRQVADRFHIGLTTVHRWMKEGKLQPYHIGGRTLFREADVMAAVEPVDYSIDVHKGRKRKGGRA